MAETYTKIKNYNQEKKLGSVNTNSKPVQSTETASNVLILSNNLPGGLIKPKNKSSAAEEDRPIFKVPAKPNKSLLGLDELARKKRLADAANAAASATPEKKVRMSFDEDEDDVEEKKNDHHSDIQKHSRHYRPQRMETPSLGAGVSESALKRMEEMKRKDRHRGTSHRDRDDRRDRHLDSRDSRRRSPDRHKRSSQRDGGETPRRGGLIKRSQWTDATPKDQAPFTPRLHTGSRSPTRHDSGYRLSTGGATAAARRTWDTMTPAVRSTAYDEVALEYPEEFSGNDEDRRRWEEEQAQLDREWYQMEDYGAADDTHNAFAQYETHDNNKEQELAQKQMKKLSAKQAQYNRDADMWEASRMLSSGVAQRIEVDTDFDEENEVRKGSINSKPKLILVS